MMERKRKITRFGKNWVSKKQNGRRILEKTNVCKDLENIKLRVMIV